MTLLIYNNNIATLCILKFLNTYNVAFFIYIRKVILTFLIYKINCTQIYLKAKEKI